jgi:C4-dicarboxylate transporter DctM subunit
MLLAILAILFVIMLLCSVPVSFVLGGSATFVMLIEGRAPLIAALQRIFSGLDSMTLLAIPFFMLAGSLMERSGISTRLVGFANSLVAHFRGGLALVSVLSCMIFAGISGSSTADTAAVGSIMMPEMHKKGYSRGFTATLLACGGTLGPIIPPSNIMIIYGSITGLSIGALFMAGIIPGILIGLCLMVASVVYARRNNIPLEPKADLREILHNFLRAIPALIMPVIIISGILSGVFTATEAGMVASFYGMIVGFFIYRSLKISDFSELFLGAAKNSASILLITGMAYVTGWMLARLQFPRATMNFLVSLTDSSNVFLLLIIIFFMLLGCFMDTIAALVIFVPILLPISATYGMLPIHFAIVVMVTLIIGQVTPPVGVLLFLTATMARISIKETLRYLVPFVGVMVFALLIISYFPRIVMFIPRLIYPDLLL